MTFPSYVNKADTRWENNGLSQDYARAAQEVLQFTPSGPSQAVEHYAGVWASLHHKAGASLLAATAGDGPLMGEIPNVYG